MECKWNFVLWAGLSLALLCFYHFLLTLNRIAWGLSVHSLATPWLCSAIIITPVESSLKIVIVISIFVDHFQQFQLLLSVDNWLLEMFSCKCFIVNTDYILNMIWFNFYFWIVSNFSFFFCKKNKEALKKVLLREQQFFIWMPLWSENSSETSTNIFIYMIFHEALCEHNPFCMRIWLDFKTCFHRNVFKVWLYLKRVTCKQ